MHRGTEEPGAQGLVGTGVLQSACAAGGLSLIGEAGEDSGKVD